MRLGIFSDIHGNIEALQATLEAYKAQGIDQYICLGDMVGYGASPKEAIQIAIQIEAFCIAGNHDYGAVGLFDTASFTNAAKTAIEWTAKTLEEKEISILAGLPLIHTRENFICVHGTPVFPERFYYIQDIQPIENIFQSFSRQLCFVGHTHRTRLYSYPADPKPSDRCLITEKPFETLKLNPDLKYIIDVGSVGQPRDNDPRASFVIYDTDAKEIIFQRVDYDIKKSADKIINEGLPKNLAERLFVGR